MSPQATQEEIDDVKAFLKKKQEEKQRKGLLPGPAPFLKPTQPTATPKLTKPVEDPKDYISDIKAFMQSKAGGGPGFQKFPDPTPERTPWIKSDPTPQMRPEGPRVKPYNPEDPQSDVEMFMNRKRLEGKGYKPVAVKGKTFTERAKSFQTGQSKATRKISSPDDIGTMRHMSSSFMLGATNMIAAMPEYVAIAAKYLEDSTGLFQRDEEIEDRALYQLGQAMRKAAHEWFPQSEELADSFLYTTLPQGAGSLAAFMALGIGGKLAKLPSWIMPLIGGATMESANLYLEAKEHGATEDEAFGAWLGGHLAGGLEAVPVGRALARFDKISGGGIKRILANGFIGGIEELTQEIAQTMTENYVAKLTFDEQRELMAGTFEAGGAGGILGAVANMMIAAAGIRTHGGGIHMAQRPTTEELEEIGKTNPDAKVAWENFYASEERMIEDKKSGKYNDKDWKKAEDTIKDKVIAELTLDPALRAGGLTTKLVKDASAEKVKARAEQLSDSGKKKPEMRDKTEDDEIDVIEGKRKEKDGLTQETMPTEKESIAAIDADIAAQQEGITPEVDIDRIRERGAGEEEVALAPEDIPDIAAAPEEAPTEAAPEVAEEPTPWAPGQPLPGEPTPQGETPLLEQAENILAQADEMEPGEALRMLNNVATDLNDEIMRGNVTPEIQDAFESVENKLELLSDAVADVPETNKERQARLKEQNDLKIRNEKRLVELEDTRTKKMQEDSQFVRDLAIEGRKFTTKKVTGAQEPGTRQTGRVGATWGVYENGKVVAHIQGKSGLWEVYEPVKGNKDRLIKKSFESRQEAFHAAVRLMAEPSTEVESEEKIEAREAATRKKLKSEKDKQRNKNFYVIAQDGQVYAMKRGQYRDFLEIGAAGKDVSEIGKITNPVKKYAKHLEAKPEGVDVKEWLEESIGKPALSLEQATADTFTEELKSLTTEEKEAGWYKDPIPEGVTPEAHTKAYKYYDVGTVEYELAIRGGIEFPRNSKGKLTQEGKDMLLQNVGAKTNARQPDYGDPIYVSEENSKGGGSTGDIEKIGDGLIEEKILAEGTSLTMLLTGRVRGKKEEGGYRGHPSLEKQNELSDEANEQLAVEQSEEGKKRAEIEALAEQRGFDLELQDKVNTSYNAAAQAEPEEAIRILSEIEVELSDYIDDSIENGYDFKDAEGYRETVREFILTKENTSSEETEDRAEVIREVDTDTVKDKWGTDENKPWEVRGSSLGDVYHGGKEGIQKIDDSKLQRRDSGFFGEGFYVASTRKWARTYGPKVTKFEVSPEATVLTVNMKASDADARLVDAVIKHERSRGEAKAKARGKSEDFELEMKGIRANNLDWVSAVDRYASENGIDIVAFHSNATWSFDAISEILIKNTKSVKSATKQEWMEPTFKVGNKAYMAGQPGVVTEVGKEGTKFEGLIKFNRDPVGDRPGGEAWTAERNLDTAEFVEGTYETELQDDAEQMPIKEVEELERDNRLAKLRGDEKKLEDLQKVKTGTSPTAREWSEELGKIETELAESIKRQKQELSPTEQATMFKEAEKRTKDDDEGTGGSPGGYYGQQTLLEEGPSAQTVPNRADVPPPPPTPPTPPEDVDVPPPTGPTEGDSDADLLKKARDAQITPEDVKKAREEEDAMTLPERVRKLVTQLQTALTSQYTPLREAQKDIYNTAGEPLPTMDAATMAEINSGMDGKAMAEFYPFREDVIDQIKDDYMDFNTYIFLRRTGDRLTDDPARKKVGSWTVGRTERALEAMRAEKGDEAMDHFERVAEKYQEHTDKMLDSIFATGIIDADSYDRIKASNDFYALFKVAKHFKSWDERLEGGGNITNDFKLLHAITGIQEEDVEAAQIVDIVGQTAKAIYNTKIRTEKQMFKMYLWEMASLDKDQKYFVQGRPDQYFIKQFKPASEILEQYGLQRMAQNRQLTEVQMIKIGYALDVAGNLGLRVDKKRMKKALGSATIGGLDGGGRIYLNAFISEVMIHEFGHSMDIAKIDPKTGETMVKEKKIFGREVSVVQRLSSDINKSKVFQGELAGLVKMTKLGGSKKYRHSAIERFAEFMNVYVHNPAVAHKMAPKWTLFFENQIMAKDKRMRDTVKKLSDFYVKIDKLPNIMTKLEELGGDSYFESAVRRAFPDSPEFLALSKGTDIPVGFKRILLRVEGKQRALDVREDIYKALEDLSAYQGAIAIKFLGKAGAVLRGGATIYNATFMVKNAFFRDPVRLALLSKYGLNWKHPGDILKFPLDWIDAMRSAWRGNFGTPDALYMRWLKSGAGFTDMASVIGVGGQTLFEAKTKTNLLNTVNKFASALEQSTKLLGFKRAIRMEKFDSLTPELQKHKINEIAAEIRRYAGSPDFWRHGMKVKGTASLMFMFMNARIQGVSADLARLGSSSRGYQKEAWLNLAIGVGLPTLGLALLNYHDDEDREYYEMQNEVERHNYYMIPKGTYYLDDNGDKRQEYWTIPKDDTAKIFSSMVESFVKFWKDEDPAAFSEFFFGFFEDISPIGISGDTATERLESAMSSLNPVLKTPFEMVSARNFYYHTDVVPRRMEGYAPEDQKRSTTPEIFVKLGKMIGQSPLMLEHLTRNITASGLTQFTPLYDYATGKLKIQEGRGIETALPVIKMFSSSSYGGTEDQLDRLIVIREAEGEDLGKRYWETEARWLEMENMKPSQFSRELREIAKTDKILARAIQTRKKKEAIGWNFMDGMIQSLGVGTGARARYIYGELKGMNSGERNWYIKSLQKKRLLTARVFQQVKTLERSGGDRWER